LYDIPEESDLHRGHKLLSQNRNPTVWRTFCAFLHRCSFAHVTSFTRHSVRCPYLRAT